MEHITNQENRVSFVREAFLYYDLGRVKSIRSMYHDSHDYRIETSKGKYILRTFSSPQNNALQTELNLLALLSSVNFPTAYPVAQRNGDYIYSSNKLHAIVYESLQGETPKITPATASEVGRILGKLATLTVPYDLYRKNSFHMEACLSLSQSFPLAQFKYPEVFAFFKRQTEYLSSALNEDLPFGLLHTKVLPQHMIVNPTDQFKLLHFENFSTGKLLMDIGIAINGFCITKEQELDFGLLGALLDSYTQERTLLEKEYELMPFYIQLGAHNIIYDHLKNGMLSKKNLTQVRHVYELVERCKNFKKIVLHL